MFKNSGKKIMGFVKVVNFLNFIVALLALAAGTFYAVTEYRDNTQVMVTTIAVVVLAVVVYFLLVYVGLLSLYAYGELVQSNLELQQTLGQIQLHLQRSPYREPVRATPRRENPVQPAPQEQPVMTLEEEYLPVPPAQSAPDRAASFSYNYKAAAGAPVFAVPNPGPRTVEADAVAGSKLCSKCGAKHDPSALNCRYCGNPL